MQSLRSSSVTQHLTRSRITRSSRDLNSVSLRADNSCLKRLRKEGEKEVIHRDPLYKEPGCLYNAESFRAICSAFRLRRIGGHTICLDSVAKDILSGHKSIPECRSRFVTEAAFCCTPRSESMHRSWIRQRVPGRYYTNPNPPPIRETTSGSGNSISSAQS